MPRAIARRRWSTRHELLEWLAALGVAPELGNAYLGTQGDVWDAQKDMALAVAGTLLAMAIIAGVRRRPLGDAR